MPKNILAALALGFLTFTLSSLPVTTAQAECEWRVGEVCLEGERRSRFEEGGFSSASEKANRFAARRLRNHTQPGRRQKLSASKES